MKGRIIPEENIEQKIFIIRGQKVMLIPHLAKFYNIPSEVLLQSVKRKFKWFPQGFIFQLAWEEVNSVRSQLASPLSSQGNRQIKSLPYAFTEQGVAMLLSILKSRRAIQTSITIMKVFIRLREEDLLESEYLKDVIHNLMDESLP